MIGLFDAVALVELGYKLTTLASVLRLGLVHGPDHLREVLVNCCQHNALLVDGKIFEPVLDHFPPLSGSIWRFLIYKKTKFDNLKELSFHLPSLLLASVDCDSLADCLT